MKINWKKSQIECCGLHETCEKQHSNHNANKTHNTGIEYYDDDELDTFAGRPSDKYTEEETANFLEIYNTMHPSDIPGWLLSLEQRNITLPEPIKQLTCNIPSL
jgi:hypothetical protein